MIERIVNIIWLLIGLGTMANAISLGLMGPMGPDSGFFPMICGVIVTACSLTMILGKSRYLVASPEWPTRTAIYRVCGVLGGLIAMAILLEYLGFAIAGVITTFVLLQAVERSSWLQSLVLSIVSVAVIMYLFGHLLGMTLPRSPWGW